MNRSEFCSLPPSLALGVLFDIFERDLVDVDRPKVPQAPKYDSRVPRKRGEYCWASEMLLGDLIFWWKRFDASAKEGGQHADKDVKNAKALEYWIKWRRAFPFDVWSGERNRQPARALPPSREPELHAWERRGTDDASERQDAPSVGGFADADESDSPDESGSDDWDAAF
jgi:hypothetical protein